MRLLIDVKPRQSTPQPINPYYIQSFIYSLLKDTRFEGLHGVQRYKYFCFSNVFPFTVGEPLEKGDDHHLLISSPDENLIRILETKLNEAVEARFGRYMLDIENTRVVHATVEQSSLIRTSTPVVVSVPASLYGQYGIESERDYLYWHSGLPLNAFVDAVSKNSVRKYNRFFGENYPEDLLLFQTFRYKRGALVQYKDGEIAGSIWEFTPAPEPEAMAVLRFILDAGLGEKNAAGFGFANVVR